MSFLIKTYCLSHWWSELMNRRSINYWSINICMGNEIKSRPQSHSKFDQILDTSSWLKYYVFQYRNFNILYCRLEYYNLTMHVIFQPAIYYSWTNMTTTCAFGIGAFINVLNRPEASNSSWYKYAWFMISHIKWKYVWK